MQLVTLPVKRIVPSGDNPRTVNEKDPDFVELAASVKVHGVQQPVQVRVHPKRKDKYELLAGARRLRAAQLARQAQIPALDYGAMPDEQAFKITFIENAHRQDLTPLEQGKAAAIALERCDGSAKAAAAILGRSERWVQMRAQIHQALIDDWQRLVMEDERFEQWTAAHLALIARFPASVQQKLFKQCTKNLANMADWKVSDLERYTAEELMLLAKAPFDTGAESKCATCLKRSSVQPQLWADKPTEVCDAKDRCLDRKCWEKREVAAGKKLLADKRAKHPDLICVSNSPFYTEDSRKLKRCYGNYLSRDSFEIGKKSDKDVKPALIVSGTGKGKIRYVKAKTTQTQTRSRKPSAKQLAARREAERWHQVATRFVERVRAVRYADLPKGKPSAICLLALMYGVGQFYGADRRKLAEQFAKVSEKGPANVLDFILERLWDSVVASLNYHGPYSDADSQKEMAVIGEIFGIDPQAMYAEIVAEEEAETARKQSRNGKHGKDAQQAEAA